MRLLPLATAFVLSIGSAGAAHAQISRTSLIAVVENHKKAALRYIDVAPDSMLTFRPVTGVRTYAEQLEHATVSNAYIAHIAITGNEKVPAFGDTAVYLHNKAALRKVAIAAMDHTIAMLQGASDASMAQEITQFGVKMPRYRALMELLDHFPWTLGQVVPYLRLNGVVPPEYSPF